MTQTARLNNGVIVEFLTPVAGHTLADCFPEATLAATVSAPDTAQIGWTYSGGTFAAPVAAAGPTQAQLLAYANAKQWALATGGHAVTVGGASHVFATDPTSLTMMGGKVARLAQPSPPASFNWQTPEIGRASCRERVSSPV